MSSEPLSTCLNSSVANKAWHLANHTHPLSAYLWVQILLWLWALTLFVAVQRADFLLSLENKHIAFPRQSQLLCFHLVEGGLQMGQGDITFMS